MSLLGHASTPEAAMLGARNPLRVSSRATIRRFAIAAILDDYL